MERTDRALDPEDATVHDVVARVPGARDVLARFGIDTCCGGDLPLAAAARHHDVDLELLLDALEIAGTDG